MRFCTTKRLSQIYISTRYNAQWDILTMKIREHLVFHSSEIWLRQLRKNRQINKKTFINSSTGNIQKPKHILELHWWISRIPRIAEVIPLDFLIEQTRTLVIYFPQTIITSQMLGLFEYIIVVNLTRAQKAI